MNKYSSDSDESLEHMKLDLLKAKYIHQKLSQKGANKKADSNNLARKHVILKKCPKPHLSSSTISNNRDIVRPELSDEIHWQDEESNCSEDEEDEDIIRINTYADSLINNRCVSSANPAPEESTQKRIRSSQDPAADGYRKDNGDRAQAYNPRTDILAQWRLRRKLSEAKHSVRSEHQKHNLQINSLQSIVDRRANLQRSPQPRFNGEVSFTQNDCEEEPVRDVAWSIPANTPVAFTKEANQKVATVDSGCQCEPQSKLPDRENNVEKKSTKPKQNRTTKRTVGIMAQMSPRGDQAVRKEGATQTEPSGDPHGLQGSSRYNEWDGHGSDRDFIDIAIQKTLQTQLFDRNCSSALSTVTSLNDSEQSQVNVVQHNREENCDSALPWNEKYQIESDDEFRQDEVLIDLRKRRALNLEKLKALSLQLQGQPQRLHVDLR